MRRMMFNALRLGLTFGFGLLALRLVSAQGSPALSLYLYLLGTRWTCQFLVDATEAAQVAAGRAETLPRLRDLSGPLLLALGIHAIATAAALLFLASAWGANSVWVLIGGLGGAVQVCAQILMAPRLAGYIARLQMGWYNAVVILRRLAELLAVCLGLWMGFTGPELVIVQVIFLGVGGIVVAAAVLGLTVSRGAAPGFSAALADQMALGLSNSLGMRAPVVVLPWLGGAELGLMIGLVVVFLGYARQAGGVFVAGLDGVARQGRAAGLVAPFPVGIGLAGIVCLGALGLAGAPNLLAVMLDPRLTLPVDSSAALTAGLRIAVIAALCRLVTDAAIKVATGLGGVGRTGRRLILPTLLVLCLSMGAALLLPSAQVLIVFGVGYAGLQLLALALLLRGPLSGRFRRWSGCEISATRAATSSPGE